MQDRGTQYLAEQLGGETVADLDLEHHNSQLGMSSLSCVMLARLASDPSSCCKLAVLLFPPNAASERSVLITFNSEVIQIARL